MRKSRKFDLLSLQTHEKYFLKKVNKDYCTISVNFFIRRAAFGSTFVNTYNN